MADEIVSSNYHTDILHSEPLEACLLWSLVPAARGWFKVEVTNGQPRILVRGIGARHHRRNSAVLCLGLITQSPRTGQRRQRHFSMNRFEVMT